jgi:flagellar motor switch/type III secretory pathway protein FliN
MEHRPYRLLNKTGLAAIERRLAAAWDAWTAAWLATHPPARIRCYRAAEYRVARTRPEAWLYAGPAAASVALTCSAGFAGRLGALLTGSGAAEIRGSASPLRDELVRGALAELVALLCPWAAGSAAARIGGAEALPEHGWEAGSGAAVAVLEWDRELVELVLGAAQVATLLPPAAAPARQPGTRIADALGGGRLTLKVLAGEVQLELGLLQTIAIGDVIKLDTRIDQPLQVVNEDGARLCGAFLGSCDGRKSVQLVATTTKV